MVLAFSWVKCCRYRLTLFVQYLLYFPFTCSEVRTESTLLNGLKLSWLHSLPCKCPGTVFSYDTEQYPFRGFHRFPCPCHGNSTPGSVPTQHLRSVCVRKMRLLGEPAIPMGLKAQSCSGSDSLAGFMWPHIHQYLLPEVCGTWTLLSHSPGQVWLGSREQWVSMWLWPPVPLVLYKAKSSDSSLSCSKQWQH